MHLEKCSTSAKINPVRSNTKFVRVEERALSWKPTTGAHRHHQPLPSSSSQLFLLLGSSSPSLHTPRRGTHTQYGFLRTATEVAIDHLVGTHPLAFDHIDFRPAIFNRQPHPGRSRFSRQVHLFIFLFRPFIPRVQTFVQGSSGHQAVVSGTRCPLLRPSHPSFPELKISRCRHLPSIARFVPQERRQHDRGY